MSRTVAFIKANASPEEWRNTQRLAYKVKNGTATNRERLDLSLVLAVAKDVAE